MHKRAAITVWITVLMAGWLFWTAPGVAAAAPKVYALRSDKDTQEQGAAGRHLFPSRGCCATSMARWA